MDAKLTPLEPIQSVARGKFTVNSLFFTVIFPVTKHDNPAKLLNSRGLGEFIRRSHLLILKNSL